jgi:EmrB/QacA subfamily drug resistance transporter
MNGGLPNPWLIVTALEHSMSRATIVAFVIAFGFMMQTLDASIVATSLPQIAHALGRDPVDMHVVMTWYFVAIAIFIPASGWVADRYGARTIFQLSIALFVAGSLACSLSSTLAELLIARVVQALGGALIVPVGRFVLLRSVDKREFVKATAYLTVPTKIGAMSGPLVGGLIVTYAPWQWIFLINIPIGIVGIVLARRYLENFRGEKKPFDFLGYVFSAIALATLLFGLEKLSTVGPADLTGVLFVCVGAAATLAAVQHAARASHPILNLYLLRIPTFRLSLWGNIVFRISWGAIPFVVPLILQSLFGMSAVKAGVLTFAVALGSISVRTVSPLLLRRFGFRRLLCTNAVLSAFSVAGCALFTANTPAVVMFCLLVAVGVFHALEINALNTLAYADVPSDKMSASTTLVQMVQQLGNALGVAFAAMLLQASSSFRDAANLAEIDFAVLFLSLAASAFAAAYLFLHLSRDAGANISGHRPQ